MTHLETLSDAKKLAREIVKGLWVAIPTPFTDDAKAVDEEKLLSSVETYITQYHVDGIFCGGVMGEFWSLTMAERKRVHELVARQANGRVPIMAQVGHHVLDEAIDLSKHAVDEGIELGIALAPYFPQELTNDGIFEWVQRLCESTPLPMFLFNTPYSGRELSPDFIAELADIDKICGIKDPYGRAHLLEVQRRVGDKIVVTDASEREWLDLHVNHGFAALMSTPAVVMLQRPDNLTLRAYTNAADQGDLQTAKEIASRLDPARDAFDRWYRQPWNEHRIIPIASTKAWLGRMGLPQGPVRTPLRPLTKDEESQLAADLDRLALSV